MNKLLKVLINGISELAELNHIGAWGKREKSVLQIVYSMYCYALSVSFTKLLH